MPLPFSFPWFLSLCFSSCCVCVCVCVFPLWPDPALQKLEVDTLGSKAPPGQKEQENKRLPPTHHHPCLLGSCCDSAEGRERRRHQGKKEGGNGTIEEGQEIKDQGSREEEKAPAAPANRFSAMPALPSVLRAAEQNATSRDARPEQKGSGALGRYTGQAAGDHWACLALQGEVLLHQVHPLTTYKAVRTSSPKSSFSAGFGRCLPSVPL